MFSPISYVATEKSENTNSGMKIRSKTKHEKRQCAHPATAREQNKQKARERAPESARAGVSASAYCQRALQSDAFPCWPIKKEKSIKNP